MPMIVVRFDSKRLSVDQAQEICAGLESSLRDAIRLVRPRVEHEYGVTVEGDPFGLIAHKQPELRINIFYHQEWGFVDVELEELVNRMLANIRQLLRHVEATGVNVKLRFYARTGHVSASLP